MHKLTEVIWKNPGIDTQLIIVNDRKLTKPHEHQNNEEQYVCYSENIVLKRIVLPGNPKLENVQVIEENNQPTNYKISDYRFAVCSKTLGIRLLKEVLPECRRITAKNDIEHDPSEISIQNSYTKEEIIKLEKIINEVFTNCRNKTKTLSRTLTIHKN